MSVRRPLGCVLSLFSTRTYVTRTYVTTGHISGSTQCPAQRRSWLSFARGPVKFSLLPTWPAFDCPSASLSSCTCAELVVLTCSTVVACLACTACHACQCCDTLCAAVTAHRGRLHSRAASTDHIWPTLPCMRNTIHSRSLAVGP